MGATILVADDDLSIGAFLAEVLTDEGHAVVCAHNGRHALAHLEANGLDLLITDNMIPIISGLELIRLMHERPDLAVPTILMSAVRPVPAPPPPTVFLPKPFDLADLLATVQRLLPR